MIENIIVYFILAVFLLIGLGMSWDQREQAILIKLGFFILAIIALAYLYIADSHYIHILICVAFLALRVNNGQAA